MIGLVPRLDDLDTLKHCINASANSASANSFPSHLQTKRKVIRVIRQLPSV